MDLTKSSWLFICFPPRRYILNSSKTFLYVVAAYLDDSTFLSYFLKFERIFAIIPIEVRTPIIIGFKTNSSCNCTRNDGPCGKNSQGKRFILVSLEGLVITPPLFVIEFVELLQSLLKLLRQIL